MIWIRIEERTPELGDYSVLVWFEHGAWDMVHVEDWFGDITNGLDENGVQQYTKWYLKQPVTHWAYVNTPEDLLLLIKESQLL